MRADVLELLRRPLPPRALLETKHDNKRRLYVDSLPDCDEQPPAKAFKSSHSPEKLNSFHRKLSSALYDELPTRPRNTNSRANPRADFNANTLLSMPACSNGNTSSHHNTLIHGESAQQIVIESSRLPIENPVRNFHLDPLESYDTNIDANTNYRVFELNPEIMVIETAVALSKCNTPSAAGTYAVWFAEEHEMNMSDTLPRETEFSNQVKRHFPLALAFVSEKVIHRRRKYSQQLRLSARYATNLCLSTLLPLLSEYPAQIYPRLWVLPSGFGNIMDGRMRTGVKLRMLASGRSCWR